MRYTLITLCILGAIHAAHSQELPDMPYSSSVSTALVVTDKAPAKPKLDKVYLGLVGAEATMRVLDGLSTMRFLSAPCKCWHEINPIAPHTASPAKIALFQAGAAAAVIGGSYLLQRKGHTRAAKALLLFDIGSEVYYVQGNYSRDLYWGMKVK